MRARLVFADDQGVMQSLDLPPQGIMLGRGPDCHIKSQDPLVSGRHCRIILVDSTWYVEDLRSTNHTFVNDQQVQRHALRHKDLIRCGSALRVQFLLEQQPAVPDPPLQPEGGTPGTQRHVAVDGGAAGLLAAQKEILGLQQEIEKLRVQLQEAQAKSQKLSEDRRTAMEEKDRYWRELSGMRDQLAAEAQVSERLRDDLKQAQEEWDQCDRKVKELTAQVEARDAQVRALEVRLRDLKQERDRLLHAGQSAEGGRTELQVAYNKLRNENEGLQQTLDQLQQRITHLEQGAREQDARLKEHIRARDEAQKALSKLTAERDTWKEECEQRGAQAERDRQQIHELELENQRLASLVGAAKGDGDARLGKEAGRLQAELERTRRQLAEAGQALSSHKAALAGTYDEIKGAIQDLRGALLSLQAESQAAPPADPEAAARVKEGLDQVLTRIGDADGQLRVLRGLMAE